eukprot:jgi/Astpho2/1536/Aster-x1014
MQSSGQQGHNRLRELQEQYQQLNEEPSDVDSEFDQEFASWELNEEVELDDDPLYFVQAQQRPGADIHGAARVGDVERARYLIEEEGIDVNLRDRWDSVPLYYACLTGHEEVAEFLLQRGAVCNPYTFDGDRCHYAALTGGMRVLLRQYEARPPPLAPLALSLRALTSLCANREAAAPEELRLVDLYADLVFEIEGEAIPVHRAVLAARSRFFRKALRRQWCSQGGACRVVHLGRKGLTAAGLKAALIYCYTERLDVIRDDMPAMLCVIRKMGLADVAAAMEDELSMVRYYWHSKQTKDRSDDPAPRRFVLQPGALPPEARLPVDLAGLRARSAALEAAACWVGAGDFADVVLDVGTQRFRCHRCILAVRSEFCRVFLEVQPRAAYDELADEQPQELPVLSLQEDAEVFAFLVEFLYTDRLERLPQHLLRAGGAALLLDAADRYLVPNLKREVAEHIMAAVGPSGQNLEQMCRLLLCGDDFSVAPLRTFCLQRLAFLFDALSSEDGPEQERTLFESFVVAVAPEGSSDLLDGSNIAGASRGKIEGSGATGLGIGSLLQDLREAYLERFGGTGQGRDAVARHFDARLQALAARAQAAESA